MKFTVKNIMLSILAIAVICAGSVGINPNYAYADDGLVQEDTQNYIRIGLKYGSSASDLYAVEFSDAVVIGVAENKNFTPNVAFPDITNVRMEIIDSAVVVWGINAVGEEICLNEGLPEVNCIMPNTYIGDGTFSVNGNNYRGGVLFNIVDDSITLINYIDVDKYLYGVINSELHHDHPMEALKAQTVAARSFSVCKLNTHKSYGFDLCTTTHCQVYKGYDGEYPETTQAVDETKGETVKYKGKTVSAFYYKNSGGHTQASEEVWSATEGYLRAKKDEYSPAYNWTSTMTFSQIETKLYVAGYNVGQLQKISIEDRYDSGAVASLVFTGSNGTATLKKEKIRTVLGGSYIKSTMFSFEGAAAETVKPEAPKVEESTGDIYGLTMDQAEIETLGTTVWVLDADGNLVKKTISGLYATNGETTNKITTSMKKEETPSQSESDSTTTSLEVVTGPEVTFVGQGYGHGVGMAQDGAIEMAKKGFTYRDILQYYYTDIEI